jgi:hypothetical protein
VPNRAAFAAAVLRGIGAPVTPHNIAGFIGWSKAEGGDNWQRNNPLNTTQDGPGVTRTINSAGVKAYANPAAGIHATVTTLRNGNYGGIVRAFRSNNPGAMPLSDLNTWGSGALAKKTIAQTLGQHFNVPSGSSSLGAPTSGQARGPQSIRIPGQTIRSTRQVFNQQAFQQAQARNIVGNLIASQPDPYKAVEAKTGLPTGAAANPLISSGLLTPGAAPNPSDFMRAQTTLQRIAGTRLAPHIGAQAGLANRAVTDAANAGAGRDAQKLLNMIHTVIGAQYNQANHAAVAEHHGQIRSQGTDCSGLISWLMGPNGLGIWSTSYATPGIPSAPGMHPGKGRLITVWNNRQAGNAGHVFIQIGNQFFASEGGVGIHQLPMSEVQNYLRHGSEGGTYQALHPKGM